VRFWDYLTDRLGNLGRVPRLTARIQQRGAEDSNELARKNQQGVLSDAERQQLESYLKVGDILSLLLLKASKSLSR
jgi:hypothetical protein